MGLIDNTLSSENGNAIKVSDIGFVESKLTHTVPSHYHLQKYKAQIPKDSPFAWVTCFAAFFVQVVIVGILHVFGVFFVMFVKEFKASKATVAWVGSSCYGVTMALGPVASACITQFGVRNTIAFGSMLCVISLVLSSFASQLEYLFFSFTCIYGLGMSLAYCPTMTIADDYFSKYLSIATGITVSGSSVGTLVLSPISQFLVDHYGWRVAMRVLAGLSALGCLCSLAFEGKPTTYQSAAQRVRRSPLSRLVAELHLWKNKVYVVWVLGITCAMFGYYIPYVHLVSHAMTLGIPANKGAILMMTLGGSSAIGRIMFGKIITYGVLDRLHMHQLSMVMTGMAYMMLPLIKTFVGLMIYVIFIGIVDGCFVVMMPLLTLTLAGVENKVLAWGYLVGVSSITFTLGPPTAGWIYDATGSYDLAFQVAAAPILVGSAVLLFIPWAQRTASRANDALSIAGDVDMDPDDSVYSVMSAWAAPPWLAQSQSQWGSFGSSVYSMSSRGTIHKRPIVTRDHPRMKQGISKMGPNSDFGGMPGQQYLPRGRLPLKLVCATSLDEECRQHQRRVIAGRRWRSVSDSADGRNIYWSNDVNIPAYKSTGQYETAHVEVYDDLLSIFNETFRRPTIEPHEHDPPPSPTTPTPPIPISQQTSANLIITASDQDPEKNGSSEGSAEPAPLGLSGASAWSTTLISIPENKQLKNTRQPQNSPEAGLEQTTGSSSTVHSSSPEPLQGPDSGSQTIFPLDISETNK